MKKLSIALSAILLTACGQSSGLSSSVSSSASTDELKRENVSTTNQVNQNKSVDLLVNENLTILLLDATKSWTFDSSDGLSDESLSSTLCSFARSNRAKIEAELKRVKIDEVDHVSDRLKNFLKFASIDELAAACAAIVVSSVHEPRNGWPLPNARSMTKTQRMNAHKETAKLLSASALATYKMFNAIALEVPASGPQDREQFVALLSELFLKHSRQLLSDQIKEYQTKRSFNFNFAGVDSANPISFKTAEYQFGFGPTGASIIQKGVPLLTPNMISGKEYSFAISNSRSASMARDFGIASNRTSGTSSASSSSASVN